MSIWVDSVPFLKNGDDASGRTFNAPIEALAGRTDYLKRRLDDLDNKGNVVEWGMPCAESVSVGDVVRFDADSGLFIKALAKWASELEPNGELMPSEDSLAAGVVVEKPSNDSATLLVSGVWKDQAIVDACIGASAVKGVYYLSSESEGKAVIQPPPVRVPVLTYLGEGRISVAISAPFQPNHSHASMILRGEWLDASDPDFDDMDKPEWAIKGYDIANDAEFQEWFAMYPGPITVFVDGELQSPDAVVATTSNLWYLGTYGGSSSSSDSSMSSLSSSSESSFSSLSSSSSSSQSSSSPSSESSSDSSASSASSSSDSSSESSSDSTETSSGSLSESSLSSHSSQSSASSDSSTSQSSQSSASSQSSSSSESSNSSSSPSSESSESSSSSMFENRPNGSSVVVFAQIPLVNGEPVVRAITTDTPCELEINADKGVAHISMRPWEMDNTGKNEALAVSRISDRTQKLIPVVSALTGSGSVVVRPRGDGVYDISSSDVVESLLDSEIVNLNNAIELVDDPYVFFNFPAGRAASITGKVSLPKLNPRNRYAVAVWTHARGVIGAKAAAPKTFPGIKVEMTGVRAPSRTGGAVELPNPPAIITAIPAIPGTRENMLYYGETPDDARMDAHSEGTVYFKLSMDSDTMDKYLLRFGVKIYLLEHKGDRVLCGV